MLQFLSRLSVKRIKDIDKGDKDNFAKPHGKHDKFSFSLNQWKRRIWSRQGGSGISLLAESQELNNT